MNGLKNLVLKVETKPQQLAVYAYLESKRVTEIDKTHLGANSLNLFCFDIDENKVKECHDNSGMGNLYNDLSRSIIMGFGRLEEFVKLIEYTIENRFRIGRHCHIHHRYSKFYFRDKFFNYTDMGQFISCLEFICNKMGYCMANEYFKLDKKQVGELKKWFYEVSGRKV